MYQTHSQPKQQQYITLLDKCTQILRQDRIWLRNMVKSGHQQAISLFKGLPKNIDMKQLQIKLRKYIMRTKQREKQQQLQRFKENMQLPDFVQLAAERKQQYVDTKGGNINNNNYNNNNNNNNQNRRGPLVENEQSNYHHPQQYQQQRSSFVAKWNNYSHYNYPSQNNLSNGYQQQQSRQLQSQQLINNYGLTSQQFNHQQQPSRSMTKSTSRKQWQNNYKPHSFNKNLNYELANKLSVKNSSTNVVNITNNNKSRHNILTTSLNKSSKNNNGRGGNNNSLMMTMNMNVGKNSSVFGNTNYNNNSSSNSRRKLSNNNNNNNNINNITNDDMQEIGRFGNYNTNNTMNNHNNSINRNSSKSLKQLQNRIYQQLKLFQQNKNKKESHQQLNKSFSSQKSIQKLINNNSNNSSEKQRSVNKKGNNNVVLNNNNVNSSNNNSSNLYTDNNNKPKTITTNSHNPINKQTTTKQSIDEILRFKLGNCDFQTYKKQQSSFLNQQQQQQHSIDQYHHYGKESQFSNLSQVSHHSNNDSKIVTSSQKKLYYNDSMFPPIEEQTQRDSESQRYPQQPLRFGQLNNNNNPANALRQQLQERQKMVFASFAKGASPASNNDLILSGNNNQHLQQQCNDTMMISSFNPQQQQPLHIINQPTSLTSLRNNNNKKISQSLYQSAQKKSDFTQNFVESQLHKSIMQSIKKSRQLYPLQGDDDNVITQPQTHIPYRQAISQVTSFSSSLYASSSNQNNNQTIFTSPQLLNECRNFLKKTQQINFQNSGLGSNFTSSLKNTIYDSPTNSQQQKKKSLGFQLIDQHNNRNNNNNDNNISRAQHNDTIMLNFPQPITITQSITKDYYEHYNNVDQDHFSQARINSMFESKQSQSSVKKNIQFETYSKPYYEQVQGSIERSVGESNHSGGDYYGREEGRDGEVMMRDSVREDNFNNNNNINNNNTKQILSSSQSGRRQQPLIINQHSRKNSSIKRHSEIEQTLTAGINNYQQPTTMQFSLSNNTIVSNPQVLGNNYMYTQQYQKQSQLQQQNDDNYRTSEFRQVQQQQQQGHNAVSNKPQQYQQQQNDQQHQQQQSQQQLYEMIQMQQIIDRLLQANQGNLQLDSTWLKHTIANHCIFQTPIARALSHLLHQFIIQPSQTHNFIDLLDVLYAYYRTQCPNYRPRKSPAADVYSLLDIEEKGYIVQEDLQNFIGQLQSAGVENIDEICHNLQQTFQLADFLSIKKIGYVNLYVIKNEDCFDALWAQLQQFEFEVEGEQ